MKLCKWLINRAVVTIFALGLIVTGDAINHMAGELREQTHELKKIASIRDQLAVELRPVMLPVQTKAKGKRL